MRFAEDHYQLTDEQSLGRHADASPRRSRTSMAAAFVCTALASGAVAYAAGRRGAPAALVADPTSGKPVVHAYTPARTLSRRPRPRPPPSPPPPPPAQAVIRKRLSDKQTYGGASPVGSPTTSAADDSPSSSSSSGGGGGGAGGGDGGGDGGRDAVGDAEMRELLADAFKVFDPEGKGYVSPPAEWS